MKRMRLLLSIQLFLVLFCSAVAAQQQNEAQKPVDRGPIQVRSDQLVAEQEMSMVSFTGNVVAVQGDVSIYADEMVLYYEADSREIERVESLGDVRIVQGERVATAQKAIYFSNEGRVVLTGSPRIHRGKNFIEGDEIIFLIDEAKSLVKSKEGRVNAVFQPGEDEE